MLHDYFRETDFVFTFDEITDEVLLTVLGAIEMVIGYCSLVTKGLRGINFTG